MMGGAMKWSRRWGRLVIPLLVAALCMLPLPALAAQGSGGGATGCDQTSYGKVDVGASMTEITAGGSVTCQMPVPGNHVAPGQGTPAYIEPGPPPADGTPCTMRALQPVTLNVGSATDVQATWTSPDGQQPAWDGWDDTKYVDIYLPGRMHLYGHQSGTSDILVPYQYQGGKYKAGQCQGGKWVEVETPTSNTACPERGDSLYIPQGSCAIGVTHLPTPVIDPVAQPPGFVLDTIRNQIQAPLGNGQVHSSPGNQGPVQGVVNVPTRFWMTGIDPNLNRRFEIVSPAPADGSGRRIVYQYVVDVQLNGITWTFDDGQIGSSHGPGSAAQWAIEHSYHTISQRGCKTCGGNGRGTAYHVAAVAHYGIAVSVVWNDGAGDHSQPVPGLTQNFDTPPAAEDLFVGQVEGVPGT